jgi:hypothetical protein
LRVLALLDSINGTDVRTHYPQTPAVGHDGEDGGNRDSGNSEDDGNGEDSGNGGNGNGNGGGGPAGSGGNGPEAGKPEPEPGFAANTNMTIPMLSLLGRAERPGEAHGLGVIDPDLARRLVAAAAKNPRSNWGVIVTDADGRAIGYGQARTSRQARAGPGPPNRGKSPRPGQDGAGGSRDGTVTFTPAGPGPQDGYGAWTLTIGDLVLTVKLASIPVGECDHRYESKGYQPSDTLRRLVEIRDGKCTLPICGWHPRGCDWEHAVPWPEGRTCSCNGGCRCRHDHRVKQSPGWKIKQLPGGYHQWTTPSGKTYTSEPYRYPI